MVKKNSQSFIGVLANSRSVVFKTFQCRLITSFFVFLLIACVTFLTIFFVTEKIANLQQLPMITRLPGCGELAAAVLCFTADVFYNRCPSSLG